MNATVYFDDSSNPTNSGWVCETDEEMRPQYPLDATDLGATDAELTAEAGSYADGTITIRR